MLPEETSGTESDPEDNSKGNIPDTPFILV